MLVCTRRRVEVSKIQVPNWGMGCLVTSSSSIGTSDFKSAIRVCNSGSAQYHHPALLNLPVCLPLIHP